MSEHNDEPRKRLTGAEMKARMMGLARGHMMAQDDAIMVQPDVPPRAPEPVGGEGEQAKVDPDAAIDVGKRKPPEG